MEPENAVYFANPGPDGKFNKDFYFHWADANNEPMNNWKDIAKELLSIPMAGLVNSLNAAVAAGIVVFEAVKQRRK